MENLLTNKNNTICGIHYTTGHTGKMSGLYGISTSVHLNKHCIARRTNKSLICSKCFANKFTKMRSTLDARLRENTKNLNERILNDDELPVIPTLYFRFESFGDLASPVQAINYIKIAQHNPNVKCALWTKNLVYLRKAIEMGYKIPKNLRIVFSSPMLNKEVDIAKLPAFVDKVFTVYDSKTIKGGVDINCGAKSCLTCGLCYNKNKVKYIREKVK